MSFDRVALESRLADGPVARVVVAGTQGSVPREVGASMLVTPGGLAEGTIGGGALEHEAISVAQQALGKREDRLDRRPLGPQLGQCCGGAVTLLTEIWTAERLATFTGNVVARALPGNAEEMPLAVSRACAKLRDGRGAQAAATVAGWMVEPVSKPVRDIWIWGAGHVGRALVSTLAPLPDLKLSWADSARGRFPDETPAGVELLIADNPADLVPLSGPSTEHYVLTYSHALDLEICHRVLGRSFGFLGLIGSATKRGRFRSRLRALGHEISQIDRICCPIGDPRLGKHPQEIAIGVATEILERQALGTSMQEQRA